MLSLGGIRFSVNSPATRGRRAIATTSTPTAAAATGRSTATATTGQARQIGTLGNDLDLVRLSDYDGKMMTYLDVAAAENALVEDEGLSDETRLSELDIRVPAYAPSASVSCCAALAR